MGLVKFVKPYRRQFTLASVAKLGEAFLELYLPILMAQILDYGIPTGDKRLIVTTGGKMFLFAIFGFLLAGVCQYYASVISQGSGTMIRDALVDKISDFSYKELDNFGSSSMINRITNDVNNYQWAVAMTMRLATRAPFIAIGAVVMSLKIDKKLAIIFFFLIPILAAVLYIFTRFASPLYQKVQKKLDEFTLIIKENLSGVRVIRAFANTEQEKERAHNAANNIAESSMHVSRISSCMQPISSLLLNIGIISILYFGASRVYQGEISQGDLLSLSMYANKILYAVVASVNLVVIYTKAIASNKRILEVLDTEPSVKFEQKFPYEIKPNAKKIKFDDVSFAYTQDHNFMENVSFEIEKGQTLGIVGITGSGKTTLVNLIQRFYDVTTGEILLDGINLKKYPQRMLRANIAVVPQQNVLFSGSVAENLRIGNINASKEDMIRALETAQCNDFIDDLSAPIFEGGKNFSGGQKQRLTIARALVKKPDILILDDSLSALDYQTDLKLREALKDYDDELTTIIVSQRISSVLSADKILVMSAGKLIDVGTHHQLLETSEEYKEIYLSQVEKEETNE